MSWLGLDIGGANLKAADGHGWARSAPFALWRHPAGLSDALKELIDHAPAAERLAITMTGELCDCFRTKAEGVRHIVSAVEQVAAGREIFVYFVDGRFASARAAKEQVQLAAASNWHALAAFACRYLEGTAGLLVDVGSTTTDIIPLVAGQVASTSLSDTERLMSSELVYTGVGRTPVCAVTRTLPWRGAQCPVTAELFATTADAYVVLGDVPEAPEAKWTADGRGLRRELAGERLARMIAADASTFGEDDAVKAAEWIRDVQVEEIQRAIRRVARRMENFTGEYVLSGSGEFLALQVVSGLAPTRCHSISSQMGPAVSTAAAAHAVAVLAREVAATVAPSEPYDRRMR